MADLDLAVTAARDLLARVDPGTSYVFWIVNRDEEKRQLWCDYVKQGLSEFQHVTVKGVCGRYAGDIRGQRGIYCLWDYKTAKETPDEVKAALGITFAVTISELNTHLIRHQLFINEP